MDIDIKYGVVNFAHDAFCSRQNRGVVMKEVAPVMNVSPMGHLVAYITDDNWLIFFMIV